jgi:NAD(P)-dependent dehydrogenase (short-subunit alcohol dehydrogenase family)
MLVGRLEGKAALITGGTSGIGRATAILFAREGARVTITGRRREAGAAVVAAIRGEGGEAHYLPCDVRQPDECDRAVAETLAAFGRIDVLFNNAGIVPFGTILETSNETWLDVFATNVHGTFYTSRAAVPHMIAQGGGVIVNNASDWGISGGQRATAYCATKGAVVQMTRAMALDFGRQGIRVNAVCPGDTYVDRWREEGRVAPEDFDAYLKRLGDALPLGRVGMVEEIARAVLFLASDDSSYMTGQLLVIDGGNTAGNAATKYSTEY